MYELHPIPFFYRDGFEILSVDETAVDLNYNRRIVLFATVQQFLDCEFGTDKVLGKTVEYESQFTSLGGSSPWRSIVVNLPTVPGERGNAFFCVSLPKVLNIFSSRFPNI